MSELERSETLVVFEAGRRRLAFNALNVRRLVAGELWVGDAPLSLGPLLGAGPGAFEHRTRVLELETSDDRCVPVLARGPMSIRTVAPSAVRWVADAGIGPQNLVEGVFQEGEFEVVVVAPDRVREFVELSRRELTQRIH